MTKKKLEPKHWARMWAKAWLEPEYRQRLEYDPLEAATEAMQTWGELTPSDTIRLCALNEIDERYDNVFARLDMKELKAIYERESTRRIATPSEWRYRGHKITANIVRDIPPHERTQPKATVQQVGSAVPSVSQEIWKSAADQWDRIYAFIYYHKRAQLEKTEPDSQPPPIDYLELFETNPRAALTEIAKEIGIAFEGRPVFQIGDSPAPHLFKHEEIEAISRDPNATGVQYIARLSC